MLLGRESEQARLDGLLEHARAGVSGVLIIRGEPGIGKSALLRHVSGRAEGMTVLSATGVESESELPFSGLAELFHPVLHLIQEIPGRQAAALTGALAVGPPAASDPFTVFAATLSLLAVAAERNPVLALVDDAHWLDASSRDALLFAARRLHEDRAALVFAVREDEGAGLGGIDELRLSGLTLDDCQVLLDHSAKAPVPVSVARQIHAATSGNPLAILEAPRMFSPAQLSGSEPLSEPLPAGPHVQHSFERRVATLPSKTRKALLVMAASQSGSIDEVRNACERIGSSLDSLDLAESAGLIAGDQLRIHFKHPLMRAAVYHGATAPDRRAAHRALAQSLSDGAPVAERAWHLAAAAQGQDEEVASTLEQAALDARRRSGHAAAFRAFERSARLTPDPEQRARRLHEAGNDAYIAGESERARQLLDEAVALARGPILQADIDHSRGRLEMWTRSPAAARSILVAAAERIEAQDPAKATLMLIDATTTAIQEGDPGEGVEGMFIRAMAVSRRAYDLGRRVGGATEAAAGGALAKILVAVGGKEEGHALLVRAVEVIDEKESLWLAVQLINYAAMFLYFEEFDRMRIPLERLIAGARAASAPGALPYALGHLSELDFRTGRWIEAYAGAAEAVELATTLEHRFSLLYALACLAWIEAARGLEADCRAHVSRLLNVSEHARTIVGGYAGRIGGLLALGMGRHEEAIKHLEPLARIMQTAGIAAPALFQESPDLIEAYVHSGHLAEAARSLIVFQRQAEASPGSWALAAAARCRGLLVEDFEPHFQEALGLHDRTSMPFERARTQLCYGERLRRSKRRMEARDQLRAALQSFEQLGAEPWATRARNELRATGETVRSRERKASDELTLQELQVALKVAEGATNREVASALFLSPKTVEAHLSHIYGKLGLRSRTELAHRFAREGAPALAGVRA
jgi:DNA-binding CsgD family transcriptional regulator